MTDGVAFEAEVEPMLWGEAVYTVIRLPDGVMVALGDPKHVEGEINDHPVNLAPTRAPVIDGWFLWAGKTLLDRIGVERGERLEIRLWPADPHHVDVPEDVQRALIAGGVLSAWEALSPGKRRAALHGIGTAKRADTRARRVAALIGTLEVG